MTSSTAQTLKDQAAQAQHDIETCQDLTALEAVRVEWLGRKGILQKHFSSLKGQAPQERSQFGQKLNAIKDDITALIKAKEGSLKEEEMNLTLKSEREDLTLPPYIANKGALHIIPQTIEEVVSIFGSMGFTLATGPDIEDDFHNFSALNFPPSHPARDTQDTFFLDQSCQKQAKEWQWAPDERKDDPQSSLMLRTHTSSVQVRTMLKQKPPIRIIVPGRCYRRDSDMTHSPMFHQVEGLYIDRKVSFGQLKHTLSLFLRQYFDQEDVPMRFRPSFFPFVEPGAEFDIACQRNDHQIRVGQGDSWLEILGCGMVHPNVLQACGLDPETYSGFAFGMGLERIGMLKYGIRDLRAFFTSRVPWLVHHGFSPFFQPDILRDLSL